MAFHKAFDRDLHHAFKKNTHRKDYPAKIRKLKAGINGLFYSRKVDVNTCIYGGYTINRKVSDKNSKDV